MNKKKLIATLFFAAITVSCSIFIIIDSINNRQIEPKELVSISTMDVAKGEVKLIAHRGLSAIAPENTLPAFEEALKKGFYAVEFDILLSKDKQWVVSHDSSLRRMAKNRSKIAELTAEQLQAIPLTNGANIESYPAYTPTLEEALELFKRYPDASPVIEIKTETEEKIPELTALLDEYGLTDRAWIISFELEPLQKCRELSGSLKIGYLTNRINRRAISVATENDFNAIDFKNTRINRKRLSQITENGLIPIVWTVDEKDDFTELYQAGIRYFTSNTMVY